MSPRDYSATHGGDSEIFATPIGAHLGDTTAVRHERCSAQLDDLGGFFCGREKGHDGPHSVPIFDSNRCYVWPNTQTVNLVDNGNPARQTRETIIVDKG